MQQRLFEIIWLLARAGGATAGEMAERFGVSRRTIYRDVDALSSAGIPIYAEKGKGGGIRLLPSFVLDKTLLSKEEQIQLMTHLQSLSALGTPDTQPMLDKLAALFGHGDSWLEVDLAPWGGGEESRELFRLLRGAIQRRQVLRFVYSSAGSAATTRDVEPCKVFFRGQGWYLQAWCRLRADYRFFKLNRIQNASPTGEVFTPRPPPAAQMPYSGPVLDVVLKLSPACSFRALDEFAPHQLSPAPGGGTIARCRMPSSNWLLSYIFSFGLDAEVLEPPELRRKVAKAVAEMSKMYSGSTF